MKKKVLIITYYWPPSGGAGVQRFLKFVKYLPQFDIEPYVLTVENPTYPIRDKSLADEVPEWLNVFTSKTIEPFAFYAKFTGKPIEDSTKPTIELNSSNWKNKIGTWIRANLFLPDARIGWYFTARKKALSIIEEHDIDAVITTGPPHSVHLIGKHIKKKCDIRWIADFRDPWTQIYYNQSLPKTSLAQALDKKMEQWVLTRADDVMVISPSMEKFQKAITNRSYHIIPNGFDHEDFKNLKQRTKNADSIIIRHVGNIGELSVPYSLFKALSKLPADNRIKVEFIGNVHSEIPLLINRYGLQNRVEIKSYIPHDQAIQAMNDADLLLLIIPACRNNELILTGKLFEYIGTQNPVIFIGPDGDAKNILQDLGNNSFFSHKDTQGLKELLLQINGGEFENPDLSSPKNLKNHPFSRFQLAEKLSQIIKHE